MFFIRFGFNAVQWEQFANALRLHGATHEVTSVDQGIYGTEFTVDGTLETPDGRNPRVRTVWIIENGSDQPRLVTAYPPGS